jgi:SAM-dependent methyltransferase
MTIEISEDEEMNFFDYGLLKSFVPTFGCPEPVVEIGSLLVDDSMKGFDVRSLFPEKIFFGIDLRGGPRVDIRGDIEGLPFPPNSIGTLLCLDTIEHVWDVHAAFQEVDRILKKDGVALITSVFNFKIHNYPHDFWRFTPEALDRFTRTFQYKIFGYQGYRKRPRHVFVIAFGEKYHFQDRKRQIEDFESLMQEEAIRKFSAFDRARHYFASLFAQGSLMDFKHYNNISIYTNFVGRSL